MRLAKCLAICLALISGPAAYAASTTYHATGTSSGGETQNASAAFVTGNGALGITLKNLISKPASIGQNISGLSFTLSDGTSSGSLVSSSGIELAVNSGGSYSVGSSVSTGWKLISSGTSLLLEVLNTPEAPKHTIIGTSSNGTYSGGTYFNANASIAGNRPHNPFLESGVTFDLAISGLTAADTITGATFLFGTASGNTLAAAPIGITLVPEPNINTLVLVVALLVGVTYASVRFRKVQ
jgi:hypothetical protein